MRERDKSRYATEINQDMRERRYERDECVRAQEEQVQERDSKRKRASGNEGPDSGRVSEGVVVPACCPG